MLGNKGLCLECKRARCAICREEGERQGAAVVLQTLVPNARQIFRLLAEAQLDASEGGGKDILVRQLSVLQT